MLDQSHIIQVFQHIKDVSENDVNCFLITIDSEGHQQQYCDKGMLTQINIKKDGKYQLDGNFKEILIVEQDGEENTGLGLGLGFAEEPGRRSKRRRLSNRHSADVAADEKIVDITSGSSIELPSDPNNTTISSNSTLSYHSFDTPNTSRAIAPHVSWSPINSVNAFAVEAASFPSTATIAGASVAAQAMKDSKDLRSSSLHYREQSRDSRDPAAFIVARKGAGVSSSAAVSDDDYVHISDEPKVAAYLERLLTALRQNNCKLVAKAWIRCIEPQKQSRYPYKNGDARKPDWWPKNVIHKEPDHLKKHERTDLLIHLLRDERNDIDAMNTSTQHVQHMFKAESLKILNQIYLVAKAERYFRTGLQSELPDDVVKVIDPIELATCPSIYDEGLYLGYPSNSFSSPSIVDIHSSPSVYSHHYTSRYINHSFPSPSTSPSSIYSSCSSVSSYFP